MTRALAALALLAATAPAGFQPGRWELSTAPTGASLDGRPLGDLPYTGPAAPSATCLAPAEPGAAWLTRDFAPGCTVTRQSLAHGRVDIAATCPSQAPGLARGTVRLTGRWTPTSYTLRFASSNPSENGVMGFTGTITGRRVGPCPATPAPPP